MRKSANYAMYGAIVAVTILMLTLKVNPYFILLVALVISVAMHLVVERQRVRKPVAGDCFELGDPFVVEVLLNDVPVATISERRFVEMFWRDYRIEPLSEETAKLVYDDRLWEQCKFTFRDPATKSVCRTGFVGGSAPFIRDGQISLRGLYFEPPAKTPGPSKA